MATLRVPNYCHSSYGWLRVKPDIKKQKEPDGTKRTDTASLKYVWVWIQKPNEVKEDAPLFVYLITGEAGNVTDMEFAQPILDRLICILQTAAPLKQ